MNWLQGLAAESEVSILRAVYSLNYPEHGDTHIDMYMQLHTYTYTQPHSCICIKHQIRMANCKVLTSGPHFLLLTCPKTCLQQSSQLPAKWVELFEAGTPFSKAVSGMLRWCWWAGEEWQLLHAVHAERVSRSVVSAGKQLNYFSFILNCEKYVQMLGSQQTLHNDT